MLVPNSLKLTIVNVQGKKCTLTVSVVVCFTSYRSCWYFAFRLLTTPQVEPTAGIHFVKRRAIEALFASECGGQEALAVKKALYFKLIHPASIRTLKDESKLFDEQVSCNLSQWLLEEVNLCLDLIKICHINLKRAHCSNITVGKES